MSKFTQGKWYLKDHYVIANDTPIAEVFLQYDDGISYTEKCKVERDANTRLIAAAPEMYEKLLDCAEFLEERGMLQCEGCSDFAAELLVSVEELLSRIDGEETE